jgi:hypothetical protein
VTGLVLKKTLRRGWEYRDPGTVTRSAVET